MALLSVNPVEHVTTQINSLLAQATTPGGIASVNTAAFVTQAQHVLDVGYDVVLGAISQVLSQTIFASRPYTQIFPSLYADARRWGNRVRKVNYVDDAFTADVRIDSTVMVDGGSVDPWVIRKPKVVEMNYYGVSDYSDQTTIFTDQLDMAFSGPEELTRFFAGLMQEINNKHQQAEEEFARGVVANGIAAKCHADTGNVRHLITEYNAYTGASLTSTTYKDPANIGNFARWFAGWIKTLSGFMRERSTLYHINPTIGGTVQNIKRHTPADMQRIFINTAELNQASTRVLTDAFNEEYLRTATYEPVNFWQSIKDGEHMKINATASYIDYTGAEQTTSNPVVVDGILGVVFDRDFTGYTRVNNFIRSTPINAKGGYSNTFWGWRFRYWQDLTENCVVLALD